MLALACLLGISLVLLLLPPLGQPIDTLLRASWVLALGIIALVLALRQLWRLRHLLAAWVGGRPSRAPADYVTSLFDSYAPRYDAHMMVDLDYAAPNLLRDLVGSRLEDRRDLRILDLGCGTGVLGPLFRRLAARLDGVDLSPAMLERARAREVYDQLHRADLLTFLGRAPAAGYDLCLAADVLVYLGDLAPVLRGVARVLVPGGSFAFTVEQDRGPSWQVRRTGRFAHAPAHVEAAALEAGLRLVERREGTLRSERGLPVPGDLYLLERPAGR